MTIDNKVSDKKLQYDANKEAVKDIIMIIRQTCFANQNCQQVKMLILLQEKLWKKKRKQFRIKEKDKQKQLKNTHNSYLILMHLLRTQSKIFYEMVTFEKTQKYYFLNSMKYIEGSLVKSPGKISREP